MPLRDGPVRRNLRLAGWDYRSPGAYGITVVSQHREWFFGEVVEGRMVPNPVGAMVATVWQGIVHEYPRVTLDAFVVMPNHLHAIVWLSAEGPAGNPVLGDVVQRFKTITTIRYSAGVHDHDWPPYDRRLWQRSYYDHVIRSADDLDHARRYIAANPANWARDPDRDPLDPERR